MRLKTRVSGLILAAMTAVLIWGAALPALAAPAVPAAEEMRGVWIPTVLNLAYPSKPGLSAAAMKAEADARLDAALAMGMNAVFLQVRPTADAFYKSDIFPWSYYLTGTIGKDPGFDPLAYWVEAAHSRGLELHAWVNPYRITHSTPQISDISELPAGHPARVHPSWVVKFENRFYFNPGIPEVRKLVADGVAEIVKNYDVDGIQFDDYFYPGNIDDKAAFETYGRAFEDLASWRRDNVDLLVKEVYERVKSVDSSCVFGISPAGIWANSSTAFGSNTRGNESYHSHYADTRKWVKLGWLDYIAPQIYWEIGHSLADYDTLARWWNDVCEGTGVKLYIGHGAYRVDAKSSTAAWRSPDELVRQLNLNKNLKNIKGSIFYQLTTISANSSVAGALRDYYAAQSGTGQSLLSYPLAINSPSRDITENVSSYYIMGTSNPALPLYINGQEVTNRSASGFFARLIPLEKGANIITARQGSNVITRTITRGTLPSSSTPASMESAGIVTSSARPQTPQYLNPGQVYRLGCTAPIGASVSVTLAGKTYNLTPAATKKPDNAKIYTTSFSYNYTVPALSGSGEIQNIGTPVYKMTYEGKTATAAASPIKNITSKAPVYMQVSSPTAWTYASNSSDGGNIGELTQGMEDYVVCTSGNWVKLGMGVWVYDDNIKIFEGFEPKLAVLGKFSYMQHGKWDYIQVSATAKTISKVEFSGSTLSYTIYNSTLKAGMAPSLPPDCPFESVGASEAQGNVTFTFRLKTGVQIDGWYVKVLSNGAQELAIKKRPSISRMSIGRPLTGIKIMLDPGHGGSASGALGPLGAAMPEKTLALSISLKAKQRLEALGAQVVMARTSDKYMELDERLEISRAERPDLFISVHLNSTAVTTDSNNVRGVLSLYREPNAKAFATVLQEDFTTALFRNDRGVKTQNLYVCRGYWTPSVLLECAFINNPGEFEWLLSPEGTNDIAASITRSVVKYFS